MALTTKKPTYKNKLNTLTGKEWIKFTKTWFVHNPKKRDVKIMHPASFPESLVSEFIGFFTKPEQIVFDPFMGSGSTMVTSKQLNRYGIGIELYEKYFSLASDRVEREEGIGKIMLFNDDAHNIKKIFKKLPKVDLTITSPPYWNQLKRSEMRQKSRVDNNQDTFYGDNKKDIGNIDDYNQFLKEQKEIFTHVYNITKEKGYLVIITNNVFANKRMYPLAFDTVNSLSDTWIPKDERIWCQDNKTLLPLGMYNAYVGNRHHQYCLIFRKQQNQ